MIHSLIKRLHAFKKRNDPYSLQHLVFINNQQVVNIAGEIGAQKRDRPIRSLNKEKVKKFFFPDTWNLIIIPIIILFT